MAKEKIFKIRSSTTDIRRKIKFYYLEKFFNKWMNKYEYPQLNYQQKHYIMKKFWSEGSVSCSSIKSADNLLAGLMDDGTLDMKENSIIFTPWAFANRYNIYDFPTHVRLINVRGVKFITQKELELDKEAVIIYAQKNHKSVYSSIEAKINELIDLEMKKRVALKAQAQSWVFAFSPEDFAQVKAMQQQIEDDNPYLFVPLEELDKAKSLTSGATYIVDKIQMQIDLVENQILTMLGVNNIGVGEKKEHLIVDEVNANNQDIEQQSVSFESEIEAGFKRVETCFSFHVDVIDMNDIIQDNTEDTSNEEDDEDGKNSQD